MKLFCALVLLAVSTATALPQSIKILKVLPRYLDHKGRHTVSPSLYERDAYQAWLRKNPDARSGLRFDVQWKARGLKEVKLRVELQGAAGKQPTKTVVQKAVMFRVGLSHWSDLAITGDDYKQFGELIAWRVTAWDGDKLVAEQKSFLW